MNNLQIDFVLKSTPITRNKYNGCFNISTLSINNVKNGIYIVNTESNISKMGHWILFYVNKKCVIYFDSFGNPSSFYGGNIDKYYNTFPCKRILTTYPVQYKYSLLCGGYCIYIAYNLCRNIRPCNILLTLSSRNRQRNDNTIENFLFHILGLKDICNKYFCGTKTFQSHCRQTCLCSRNNNVSTSL